MMATLRSLLLVWLSCLAIGLSGVLAFVPPGQQALSRTTTTTTTTTTNDLGSRVSLTKRFASTLTKTNEDICTVQILMSDTGGGHRASANALRDAFDELYPGKIECDIVDIYTEYGPVWPFNDYPRMYKIMAEYSFLWDWFYHFGSTPFGLWMNELVLDLFCYDAFKDCLNRPSGSTKKRADMVVSVHPLCQDLPLKILADLDTSGQTRDPAQRNTPFATVVTDLGGAHPTWFNGGYVYIGSFCCWLHWKFCWLVSFLLARNTPSNPSRTCCLDVCIYVTVFFLWILSVSTSALYRRMHCTSVLVIDRSVLTRLSNTDCPFGVDSGLPQ